MPVFQSANIRVERDADGSAALILDVRNKSFNVFNRQVLADLDAALDAVLAERTIPVLVVRSGKPTGFLAGADLSEFLAIRDEAAALQMSVTGQKLFDKLAALPMPTIAAVAGPCLGGGLELALACDYRLVFDRPATQLGLPEVELGLLPGWGGTQRLPRTVGLERAFMVILGGKRLSAREALHWQLADAIATTEKELREQFAELTKRAITEGKVRRDRYPIRTWRQRVLESNFFGRRFLFRGAEHMIHRKAPEDMPARGEALEAVRVGFKQGVEAGLAYERAAVSRLAVSPACHNLIGLFFEKESRRKPPAELRGATARDVKRVGVVGAGTMGAGIIQLAAIRGCQVVVQEINEEALGLGLVKIKALFDKGVDRGVLSLEDAARAFTGISGTLTWERFDQADVVVEAALEDLAAKQKVFHELAARARPDAVLATNTSSLSVALLQEGVPHPGRVAGLHFFNPVHKMPLVEVARAPATDDATLATLTQWAVKLGKLPVLVRDSPGFVVNRVLMPYLNEAVLLVAGGLKLEQIDQTMRRFGMPMGPLELLDQIGLDVASQVAESMQPVLAGRFASNPAFALMKEKEWFGQKSGKGFYHYRAKKPAPNVLAQNLLQSEMASAASAVSAALPAASRLHEARERMVLLMVNEAALALGQGLVAEAETLDVALVFGSGWAPHRGGPLHYADQRGLGDVVQALATLAERHGPRFQPCAELASRAGAGQRFTNLGQKTAGLIP
jgi:3-hydroxyacyl-CoA dehydrogenase/enoyl-CoA hydratase/3-hydroxybutyryl-CoA epimerase